MTRTLGSLNKHKRKDKGKRRKTYRGKPCKKMRKKNGKFVPYIPKRKYDSPIKIAFWKIDKMSQEKYMHFDKDIRRFMRRETFGKYPGRIYLTADPMEINSKEKLGEFAREYLWEGKWLIMLPSHAKNKFHVSYKAHGYVILKDTSEGLKAKVIPSFKSRNMGRYWFWEKN